jgi:DNA (cytosine-5)-methyltransferase 1
VFRIAEATRPRWIVLENVPNLLGLHSGAGMAHITSQLEAIGYRWAYRTVDSRFTGVPHRRPRVIILASSDRHPASALLCDEAKASADGRSAMTDAWGFYWTEGRNGLGLVEDAIPTLKGGSTLGLPSAPAIWLPGNERGRRFILPDIEDGEALQGLPRGWTSAAVAEGEPDLRWKLVGNAVTVGVGRWIGRLLAAPRAGLVAGPAATEPLDRSRRWPDAGWGDSKGAWRSVATAWPDRLERQGLAEVVDVRAARSLSHRATTGFLSRLDESGRKVPRDFYRDLEVHQAATRPPMTPAPESWASSDGTRRRMKAQRGRDTKPEIAIRRALHRRGLRYRLQVRPSDGLRVRVDIAFMSEQVAVDVRGCFWHRCPTHRTSPRANAERWAEKLDRNVERDAASVAALTALGWHVAVVWEHEDPEAAADRVAAVVLDRRSELQDRSRSRVGS